MQQQRQPRNWEGVNHTECTNLYQCIDHDPFLNRRTAAIFKIFMGFSDGGSNPVNISINHLSFISWYGRTQTIQALHELEALGCIIKTYTGGANIYDRNKYDVRIPRFYYDWIVPKEKKSKFTDRQKMTMAIRELKRQGIVGETELRYAMLLTKLSPLYKKLASTRGLAKAIAKGKIEWIIKKFKDKYGIDF